LNCHAGRVLMELISHRPSAQPKNGLRLAVSEIII
jgi:hypothetical protein